MSASVLRYTQVEVTCLGWVGEAWTVVKNSSGLRRKYKKSLVMALVRNNKVRKSVGEESKDSFELRVKGILRWMSFYLEVPGVVCTWYLPSLSVP